MTDKREELIEEAAKAMYVASFGHAPSWEPSEKAEWCLVAREALKVFEQSHTPTIDERESLARAQWNDPMNVITWDELTEKAERDEADYREIRQYALNAAERGIAAGFRRTVQGEPTDAPRLPEYLCPKCGWHLSSHARSQYGLDCPWGQSPAARSGLLAALRAAAATQTGENRG